MSQHCYTCRRPHRMLLITVVFVLLKIGRGNNSSEIGDHSKRFWPRQVIERKGPQVTNTSDFDWRGNSNVASSRSEAEANAVEEETTTDKKAGATQNFEKREREKIFQYIKKKGRIIINLHSGSTEISQAIQWPSGYKAPGITNANATTSNINQQKAVYPSHGDSNFLSVSMDPIAATRLLRFAYLASTSFLMAFLGTLKLLGPIIFARRVLAQIGELISDYMMGRYLRTTYDHIERKYWKEYQGPAASRSLGRCLFHTTLLLLLGKFMEWMVGLGSAPCLIAEKGTCHWWCGLLWIISVVGTGNIGAIIMANRGLLKIKVTKSALGTPRPKRVLFTRPLNYLQWMRDPDRWITSIATSRRDNGKSWKPFTPEPLLFPCTWPPFALLRNFAVAKSMASSSNLVHNSMHIIMRQFLFQNACMDEWHRVLMEERRVGLGVFAIAIGFLATSFLFVSVALTDSVSAVLMLPWLTAVFASGWMNLFVWWDRKRDKVKRHWVVVPVLAQNRRPLASPTYAIKW